MNVEDSYEGALRRLERLEHAGFELADPENDRMRDLEELATLACDENERLKEDKERLAEQLCVACAETEQLARQLTTARGEADRQQRLVATLQEMLASAQSEEPPNETLARELEAAGVEIERLQQQVAALQQMMMAQPEPDLEALKPRGRGGLAWLFAGALAGAAAFVLMLRPWEVRQIVAVEAPVAVAAPVLPRPEPVKVEAPKVEIPKVEKVEIPKIAAPRVEIPRLAKAKPQRRHVAKHHAAKPAKHSSVARNGKYESRGDDPLAGLNL